MADDPNVDPLPELILPAGTDDLATPPPPPGGALAEASTSLPEGSGVGVELPGRIPDMDEEPGGPSSQPQQISGLSEEAVLEAVKDWDHDKFKRVPAYNAQVSKIQQQIKREAAQREEEGKRLRQWDAYFRRLTPEQLLAAREDERTDDIYRKVREFRRTGTSPAPSPREVTSGIMKRMKGYYQNHPEWGTLLSDKWSELEKESDPSKFLTRIVDTGLEAKRRSDEEVIKTRVEAAVAEELAKHNLNPRGPSIPPGTQRGGAAVMTREQYNNLTQEQQNRLTPAQVDALYAYWNKMGV